MAKLLVVLLGIMSFFFFIGVFSLIAAFPTMWLWNWLMPDIFSLPAISFWQALGINILSGILFKRSSSSSSSKN